MIQRTVELMRQHDTDDVHPFGGINLDLLQKYVNFHYSVSMDLFGSETSTNAANYFAAGIKGRFKEEARDDDHVLQSVYRLVPDVADGAITSREVTQLAALNETLRDDYTEDCQRGVDRWNRTLTEAGADVQLVLPHGGFHRNVGSFRSHHVSPDGRLISEEEWTANESMWLPTEADREHVLSLMVGVHEPGRMAGWVAPPATGIHQQPVDYEYVKI